MSNNTRTRRIALAGAATMLIAAGTVAANAVTESRDRGPAHDRGHHGKPNPGWHGHGKGQHHRAVELVTLRAPDGRRVGRVVMRQRGGKVVVHVTARGLEPGFHGFHVHSIGLCEPDAPEGPFTTAGGHYTGGSPDHGDHAGDLPSLLVTEDGQAWASFVTDRFTLAELRDADGSAVMVHAGRDNFANIPERYTSAGVPGPDADTLSTGDAGSRAACGVVD